MNQQGVLAAVLLGLCLAAVLASPHAQFGTAQPETTPSGFDAPTHMLTTQWNNAHQTTGLAITHQIQAHWNTTAPSLPTPTTMQTQFQTAINAKLATQHPAFNCEASLSPVTVTGSVGTGARLSTAMDLRCQKIGNNDALLAKQITIEKFVVINAGNGTIYAGIQANPNRIEYTGPGGNP